MLNKRLSAGRVLVLVLPAVLVACAADTPTRVANVALTPLGDLNIDGAPGERGVIYSATVGRGGRGGNSWLGGGASPGGTDAAGGTAVAYGGGGAGGHAATATNRLGGAGGDGVLYLIEFLG